MLRAWHRGQAVDDLERVGIDHVDLAGHEVGRIDPRRLPRHSGTEHADASARIDVVRINRRGHREVGWRQENRPLGGVGLGATRERLTRIYGAQHAFLIRELPEGGTEVSISLPLRSGATKDPNYDKIPQRFAL